MYLLNGIIAFIVVGISLTSSAALPSGQPGRSIPDALVPRSGHDSLTTIQNDIKTIDASVQGLISSLQNFNGGALEISQPLAIIDKVAKVHNANRKAYSDAQKIQSPFSLFESAHIITVVEETLVVNNPRACAFVKQKKPRFDAVHTSWIVLASLKMLLQDHLSLSEALVKWVDPDQVTRTNLAVAIITVALEDAIDLYS